MTLGRKTRTKWLPGTLFMKLFLRIYAHCANDEIATMLADRFMAVLHKQEPWQDARPYPYWKIPGYYGFDFLLTRNPVEDFEAVIAFVGHGWQHRTDRCGRTSVWVHGGDSTFIAKEVAWAELQLVDEAPHDSETAIVSQGATANGSKAS